MSSTISLQHDKYYHIFNKGINGTNIFNSNNDYRHFLNLFEIYIEPIADTYAWCLMPNHFHLLIRIKADAEIGFLLPDDYFVKQANEIDKEKKWKTYELNKIPPGIKPEQLKKPVPFRMFGHLFNAYTSYFNTLNNRTGSLFEKNFHRKEVTSERYFKQLVYYIHNNPVHHGFVTDMIEYPWSSYLSLISVKATRLNREKVLGWFNSKQEFIEFHKVKQDLNIDGLLIE